MKTTFIALLLIISCSAFSQTFYVKPDEGNEQPIIDKLLELKMNVTMKPDNSDYTIECEVEGNGMSKAKGYLVVSDTKSGNVVAKSDDEKGSASVFNGYKTKKAVMEKLAKKDLEGLMLQVEKSKK